MFELCERRELEAWEEVGRRDLGETVLGFVELLFGRVLDLLVLLEENEE